MIHIDISPLGVDKVEVDQDELFEICMEKVWPLVSKLVEEVNRKLRLSNTKSMLFLEKVCEVKNELRRKRTQKNKN